MILDGLILVALFIVNIIVSVFPDSNGFPVEVETAISQFSGYANILSPILPLSVMVQLLTYVVLFEIALFSFKGFKWIMSHIPYIGGRGQ